LEFVRLTPSFIVEDVARSLAFYEALGFARWHTIPAEAPFEMGMVGAGGVRLMFWERTRMMPSIPQLEVVEPGRGGPLRAGSGTGRYRVAADRDGCQRDAAVQDSGLRWLADAVFRTHLGRVGEEALGPGVQPDDLFVEHGREGHPRSVGQEAGGRRAVDFFGVQDVGNDHGFERDDVREGKLGLMLAEEDLRPRGIGEELRGPKDEGACALG
jgi:catechol 2,3-dioxygenase-like lactoylglutathione lyase family enzyme